MIVLIVPFPYSRPFPSSSYKDGLTAKCWMINPLKSKTRFWCSHLFWRNDAPMVGVEATGIWPWQNRDDNDVLPTSISPTTTVLSSICSSRGSSYIL